jgi:hypothetical protein
VTPQIVHGITRWKLSISQAITFDGELHASPDGLNELFMYQLPHALYAIVDFSRMTCSPCKDSLEPTLLD